jgi:hypothetical protein
MTEDHHRPGRGQLKLASPRGAPAFATATSTVKHAVAHALQLAVPNKPVKPFGADVQFDAYHNSGQTRDMPGYPTGYWLAQASPFLALAGRPLDDT